MIVGTSEGDCGGMPVSLKNDDAQNEVGGLIQVVLKSSSNRRMHDEKILK